jgi:hypothetical protein
MKKVVIALIMLHIPLIAMAEEGFYISLGLGGDIFYGERMPSEDIIVHDGAYTRIANTNIVSTDLGGLFALEYNMGYNVMNYASLELKLNFTGSDITKKGERRGGGFISGIAKYHPLNHWKKGYFIDPYIFLGGGYSMVGLNVEEPGFAEKQSKAIAGLFFETGLGSDFYIKRWFSLFLDLNFYFPSYSKFYYDWDKNVTHDMNNTPSTTVFSIILGSRFHFNIKE